MTLHATSGALRYSDVKGMHVTDAAWSIWTRLPWGAFTLLSHEGTPGTVMTPAGLLTVMPGYIWDGSSGPTIDGAADPVPSLVHDVLYEAMRARRLSPSLRGQADQLYYDLLRERGMSRTRAGARWLGLRLFGRWSASPAKGPQYPHRVAR